MLALVWSGAVVMYGEAMQAGRGHHRIGWMTAVLPPADVTQTLPALMLSRGKIVLFAAATQPRRPLLGYV